MQIYYDFAGFENIIPKLTKIRPKRSFCDFVFRYYQKFMFFQKNQLGIGVWWQKVAEIGQKLYFRAFYSEI